MIRAAKRKDLGAVDAARDAMGDRIRTMRKAAGLTRRQLGEAVGVQVQTVARWESHDSLPRRTAQAALCDALGCDLGALTGGAGSVGEQHRDRCLAARAKREGPASDTAPPALPPAAPDEPPELPAVPVDLPTAAEVRALSIDTYARLLANARREVDAMLRDTEADSYGRRRAQSYRVQAEWAQVMESLTRGYERVIAGAEAAAGMTEGALFGALRALSLGAAHSAHGDAALYVRKGGTTVAAVVSSKPEPIDNPAPRTVRHVPLPPTEIDR